MTKEVIGEGAYGCVHKPSIHCKKKPNNNFDYTNYVSKLMRNEHAIDELNEFVVIKKNDPNNEYHLGTPEICNPYIDEKGVKESIAKCKHIDVNKVVNDQRGWVAKSNICFGPILKGTVKPFLLSLALLN